MGLRRCKSFQVPGLLTVTVHRVHNIQSYTCITHVLKQAFRKVNYMPRKRVGAPGAGPLPSLLGLNRGVRPPAPLTRSPPQPPPRPRSAARPEVAAGAMGLQTCPSPTGCHRARPTTRHNGFWKNFPGLRCQLFSQGNYFPPKMLINIVRKKRKCLLFDRYEETYRYVKIGI